MERFAKIKNIGTRRKLDVNAICRCCGLDSGDMQSILNQFSDDGVDFQEKVSCLTGINVQHADKMPQSMCDMCQDKINDFYEFRLMAQNTEKQTREALGLPLEAVPVPRVIHHIETKPAVVRLFDLKYSVEDNLLIQRALGRNQAKPEDIPSTSTAKKRPSKADTPPQPPPKKSKKDVTCAICTDSHFAYQSDLNDHLMKVHLPQVAKYACGSCRETFDQLSDHKAHENWHSKEKLPFTCFNCFAAYARLRDFSKHMTNYNCPQKEKLIVTVEDIKCFQCKKKFLTQNLFEWHGCFLKTRGTCSKCGKYFAKKQQLFKHYILCEGLFVAPESARDPSAKNVKSESAGGARAVVKVSGGPANAPKGPKKKTVPNRKVPSRPIVKKELHLESTLEPAEDEDFSNYDEDITYDNFGNDSDSNDDDAPPTQSALEPLVQLQEQQPKVSPSRIKKEKANDTSTVQQSSSAVTAELIRNVKKEKGAQAATVVTTNNPLTQQQKNIWKLKIKAERGANQSPATQVLNPMSIGGLKPAPKKNIFKIPQSLRTKIKLERKDAGYGDNIEERDEAEPEDEDLMSEAPEEPSEILKIKQEKVDPVSVDVRVTKKAKQLINPMALMMREKSISNGSSEKSLVISAVTSISAGSPVSADIARVDAMTQNAQETPETNDVTTPHENLMMVQIPREFLENQENHSSKSVESDESSQVRGSGAAAEAENVANEKNNEIPTMNTNDDLDALLKEYENQAPTDNNDIFQELLKFD